MSSERKRVRFVLKLAASFVWVGTSVIWFLSSEGWPRWIALATVLASIIEVGFVATSTDSAAPALHEGERETKRRHGLFNIKSRRGLFRGQDGWWVTATALLCILTINLVLQFIFTNTQTSSSIWHSPVFQDLSYLGTLLAAGAAWLSALSARRRAGEASKSAPSGTEGMNDNEYKFLTDMLEKVARGELTPAQVKSMERVIETLNSNGRSLPIPDQLAIEPGSNGNSAKTSKAKESQD